MREADFHVGMQTSILIEGKEDGGIRDGVKENRSNYAKSTRDIE